MQEVTVWVSGNIISGPFYHRQDNVRALSGKKLRAFRSSGYRLRIVLTLSSGISFTIASGQKLFGASGWKDKLAHKIGVDGSTVRRWVSGVVPVPNTAWAAIDCWLKHGTKKIACKPVKKPLKKRFAGSPSGKARSS